MKGPDQVDEFAALLGVFRRFFKGPDQVTNFEALLGYHFEVFLGILGTFMHFKAFFTLRGKIKWRKLIIMCLKMPNLDFKLLQECQYKLKNVCISLFLIV